MEDLGRKLRRTRVRSSSGLSPHGGRSDSPRKFKKGAFLFPIWMTAVLSVAGVVGAYLSLQYFNTSQIAGVMDILAKMTFK